MVDTRLQIARLMVLSDESGAVTALKITHASRSIVPLG